LGILREPSQGPAVTLKLGSPALLPIIDAGHFGKSTPTADRAAENGGDLSARHPRLDQGCLGEVEAVQVLIDLARENTRLSKPINVSKS
jgi:hypothetical protein